jgi:hypothetical protein
MKAFNSRREAKEFPVDLRPRVHRLLLACLFSFVVALNAFAQQAPPKIEVDNGRLHTFRELLVERNVELSESALLAALKSSHADERYLSAMELAEDKVVGCGPGNQSSTCSRERPSG